MLKKFTRSFRYGQKGFTLVELLIVIAILGVLAAVVIPNVSKFTKSSAIAAGKAERQTLQTSVDAMMADAGIAALTAAVTGWQGAAGAVTYNGTTYDANQYLRRTPTKGTYSVATEGTVTCTAYPGLSDAADIAKINA